MTAVTPHSNGLPRTCQVERDLAGSVVTAPARNVSVADAGFGLAMFVVLAAWTLRGHFWKDFRFEAEPAVRRLLAGDLHGFLALSPVYSGSMVLRAPVMTLAGNVAQAYRLGAVECALPLVWLAVALTKRMRAAGERSRVRWIAIALIVLNPVTARALQIGHPEDVLAAALMVGAMLLALDGRSLTAGLLLGVAVASKQWALIGLPLTLAALPVHRARLLGAAAAGFAVLVLPVLSVGPAAYIAANRTAASAVTFMNPANVWWLLGGWYRRHVGGPTSSILAAAPTDLAARISHPAILIVPVLLGIAWYCRRERLVGDDVLLLLAAASLLRCLLDPWNIVYYHLPFLLVLAAWELRTRTGAPVRAMSATALVWFTFQTLPLLGSGGLETTFYLAWAIPATIVMTACALQLISPAVRAQATRIFDCAAPNLAPARSKRPVSRTRRTG